MRCFRGKRKCREHEVQKISAAKAEMPVGEDQYLVYNEANDDENFDVKGNAENLG